MRLTFQNKIEACKLASMAQMETMKDFKSKIQEALVFNSFFLEKKYGGSDRFLDLWTCYGLTDANIYLFNSGWQSNVSLFHSKYNLMEKWFEILFDGKIAFKPFFDIEIEQHNRIRENAYKKGIKHLVLKVDFEKIAKIIDFHFISIKTAQLNINVVNGAVIPPLPIIDNALVADILRVSYAEIGTIEILKGWIQKIIATENQTITQRLDYLNVFGNSLLEAMKTSTNALTNAYLKGLYAQVIKWIHESLDLVEWLCGARFEQLPIALSKEFTTCRLLHGWKSNTEINKKIQK